MTIADTPNSIQYLGNGATDTFSTGTIIFYEDTDLEVIETVIATGVSTALTITTDYTVSGGDGEAGSITLTAGNLPTTKRITINRKSPYEQTVDFVEGEAVLADELELSLDKIVVTTQQVRDLAESALRIPVSADSNINTLIEGAITTVPKVLQISTTGVSLGSVVDENTSILNFETQTFSGDNSETDFTLTTFTPVNAQSIEVSVGGSLQVPIDDYTVSGSVVQFTSAPANGTDNIFVRNLATGSAAAGVPDNSVTTVKVQDAAITLPKLANIADLRVIGNISGSPAAPAAVEILDEDNMVSDSATKLATQQSIKAYVDTEVGVLTNMTDYTVPGNLSGGVADAVEITVFDENDMASDSDTALATQQSIKAYVDNETVMRLVSTIDVTTAVASVDFAGVFEADKNYMIVISDCGGQTLRVRFEISGSFNAGANYAYVYGDITENRTSATTPSEILAGSSSAPAFIDIRDADSYVLHLPNPASSDTIPALFGQGVKFAGSSIIASRVFGSYASAQAATGIQFYPSSSTISSGKISIYELET